MVNAYSASKGAPWARLVKRKQTTVSGTMDGGIPMVQRLRWRESLTHWWYPDVVETWVRRISAPLVVKPRQCAYLGSPVTQNRPFSGLKPWFSAQSWPISSHVIAQFSGLESAGDSSSMKASMFFFQQPQTSPLMFMFQHHIGPNSLSTLRHHFKNPHHWWPVSSS